MAVLHFFFNRLQEYRRGFLDQYVPNETAYLPRIVREHLGRIGQPPAHGERPAGTYARQILNRPIIDLSWASSRLEGNTYSRLDTERLIQFGQSAEGKDAIETQMILNHKAAIEFLVDRVDELRFNSYTLFHRPEPDREAFVDLASMEIARLHEGTIARFRLRPSEYELWKSKTPSD